MQLSEWREEKMSSLTSPSGEACVTSSPQLSSMASQSPKRAKKKRGLPGNPDPDAEVIALSPKTLMAINRFVCEVCNKGFQRDQNLQLHRRGHNLPWKLKQRAGKDQAARKKVYICPEVSCVHHDPSRALGDLTGIKKHFFRKHGEKKWKCDKCSKKYAVQSDWKAHSKICGTREYRCDCGTLFSRRDSFITHRAFCDALAEETAKAITPVGDHPHQQAVNPQALSSRELPAGFQTDMIMKPHEAANLTSCSSEMFSALYFNMMQEVSPAASTSKAQMELFPLVDQHKIHPSFPALSPYLSATALLQKAAQMGAIIGRAHQHVDQMAGFSSGQGEIWNDSNLQGLGTRAGAFDHEIEQDRNIGGCERGQVSEVKSEKGRGRGRGRGDSNQLTLDLLGKGALLELDQSMNDSSSYEEAALRGPYWHQ